MGRLDESTSGELARETDSPLRPAKRQRHTWHKWEPIGDDWYFCKGCHVWRHKAVCEWMKWKHTR